MHATMATGTASAPAPALVVEDDPVTRMLLVKLLETEGFQVHEAADGESALERFAEHPALIVLLDVLMPGINGFETCAAIRQKAGFSEAGVLMLTALDDTDSIDRAFEAGATDFNIKPINWPLLRRRVRYALRMQRLYAESELNQARLAQAQRVARVAHWEYDPEVAVFHWSVEMRTLLGLGETNADNWLADRIPADDRTAIRDRFKLALRDGTPFTVEHRVLTDADGERVVLVRGEPTGSEGYWIGTIQDITDIRQAEAQVQYVTRFDPVTGLPNCDALLERLTEAILEADVHQQRVGLLVFKLTRYKAIQESMGSPYADRFLGVAAERLTSHLGSDITVARLGDDEFALIVTDLRRDGDAVQTALAVRERLVAPIWVDAQAIYTEPVPGIAVYPTDAADAATLLTNANVAMRNGYEQNHQSYCFYTADMNARVIQEIALEQDLRRALAEDQFTLYYQPQLDAASEETVGFEALLRWNHPKHGIMSPATFIPVLESTGLITQADCWVLETADRQCRAWNARSDWPVRMAVNLSAEQLTDPGLLPYIEQAVRNDNLHPAHIELEITETVAMHDLQASQSVVQALRALGFSIAIDDFGTGNSSLMRLRQLPVDKLKIDSSFVFNMHTSEQDASIVRSCIHLAHELGLSVVAEGVEEAIHVEMLREMGCDILQGFYFGRPLPVSDAEAFIHPA
ncbi:EAL domain-containing protein [Spiribacter aquaticus]|uniref:EAL domain-containing protein n=2 Tax=Ectothiorhodospiraceae TaxID=72276 RepID=A0A557RLT2_9GAMM|nr:hypothetical protein BA897_00200 [Spiribacter roseus]TVO66141.1 EAL domain-containing protein [Spiribacter aquaticus]